MSWSEKSLGRTWTHHSWSKQWGGGRGSSFLFSPAAIKALSWSVFIDHVCVDRSAQNHHVTFRRPEGLNSWFNSEFPGVSEQQQQNEATASRNVWTKELITPLPPPRIPPPQGLVPDYVPVYQHSHHLWTVGLITAVWRLEWWLESVSLDLWPLKSNQITNTTTTC